MSDANAKSTKSISQSSKQVADSQRHSKIKAAAYELATARGFKNGNQMEDWLEAEKNVDALPPR